VWACHPSSDIFFYPSKMADGLVSALGYGSGRIYYRECTYNTQLSLKVPVKYTVLFLVSFFMADYLTGLVQDYQSGWC